MAIALTDYAPTVGTTEVSVPRAATYDVAQPQTTVAHVELVLDLALLAAADAFRVKLYEKATAAGTQRLSAVWRFSGAQADPLTKIPLGLLGRGWDVTLQKIVGTDRSIPCSLRIVS